MSGRVNLHADRPSESLGGVVQHKAASPKKRLFRPKLLSRLDLSLCCAFSQLPLACPLCFFFFFFYMLSPVRSSQQWRAECAISHAHHGPSVHTYKRKSADILSHLPDGIFISVMVPNQDALCAADRLIK